VGGKEQRRIGNGDNGPDGSDGSNGSVCFIDHHPCGLCWFFFLIIGFRVPSQGSFDEKGTKEFIWCDVINFLCVQK
jgi:hypothetical protein